MSQISEDGFWKFENGEWVASEKQKQALSEGAIPHYSSNQSLPQQSISPSEQMIILQQPDRTGRSLIIVLGIVVVCIAVVVILAGILYVWASTLASGVDANLVGTWSNPVETAEFSSNGELALQTNDSWDSWKIENNNLVLESSSHYFEYKYEINGNILFLGAIDEEGDLMQDGCVILISGTGGKSQSYYDDNVLQAEEEDRVPTWCEY